MQKKNKTRHPNARVTLETRRTALQTSELAIDKAPLLSEDVREKSNDEAKSLGEDSSEFLSDLTTLRMANIHVGKQGDEDAAKAMRARFRSPFGNFCQRGGTASDLVADAVGTASQRATHSEIVADEVAAVETEVEPEAEPDARRANNFVPGAAEASSDGFEESYHYSGQHLPPVEEHSEVHVPPLCCSSSRDGFAEFYGYHDSLEADSPPIFRRPTLGSWHLPDEDTHV